MLLIRAGHWLWKWHKQEPRDKALIAALESVWRAKREYRAPMIAKRKMAMEKGKTLRSKAA
jgi:hypothetical protein